MFFFAYDSWGSGGEARKREIAKDQIKGSSSSSWGAGCLWPPRVHRPHRCFSRLLCFLESCRFNVSTSSLTDATESWSVELRTEPFFSNICPSCLPLSSLNQISSEAALFWLRSCRATISTRGMWHICLLFKAPLIPSSFQLRAHKDDWLLAHFPSPWAALFPSRSRKLYCFQDRAKRNIPLRAGTLNWIQN